MNAWHQGRSPGRKGKFTDLFLSLFLSFVLWFCAVYICLYLALLTLLSPFLLFTFLLLFLHFSLHTASVWSQSYRFSSPPNPPLLDNSIFSFYQKWFFHFQSKGLPPSILILQMLTLCLLSVKTSVIVRIRNKSESQKLLDSKLTEMVCKHTGLEGNAFISKTNSLFLKHS